MNALSVVFRTWFAHQQTESYSEFEEMTPQEIADFISNNEWRFAKTMPEHPHEYCLKRKCSDPKMFERFVVHIRRHGYKQKFGKTTYTYLDVAEHQYWTMGGPLPATILINRAVKR